MDWWGKGSLLDGKAVRKKVLETFCVLEMVLEIGFLPHSDSCNNSTITFHSASITSPFSSPASPENIIVFHMAEFGLIRFRFHCKHTFPLLRKCNAPKWISDEQKGNRRNYFTGAKCGGEKIISHAHWKFVTWFERKWRGIRRCLMLRFKTEGLRWMTPCQEKCMRNSQERKSVNVMALSREGESDYCMLGLEYNAI